MQDEHPIKEIIDDLKRTEYLRHKPKTLYKYRDWNNDYHKRLITAKEIYFASANQFNDPFDCNPPFRFDEKDLTQENIFTLTLKHAKNMYPTKTDTELHEIVFQQQKNHYLLDDNYLQEIAADNREEINKQFGILSLSADEKNFLMWSHYSKAHTGYCVGFNSYNLNKLCEGTLERVSYESEIPKIPLLNDKSESVINFLRTILFTKSKIWEYEKEFRITKNAFSQKKMNFSSDCIDEIIFGCSMKHKSKLDILNIIEHQYSNALVYEMILHKKEYKIQKIQIR